MENPLRGGASFLGWIPPDPQVFCSLEPNQFPHWRFLGSGWSLLHGDYLGRRLQDPLGWRGPCQRCDGSKAARNCIPPKRKESPRNLQRTTAFLIGFAGTAPPSESTIFTLAFYQSLFLEPSFLSFFGSSSPASSLSLSPRSQDSDHGRVRSGDRGPHTETSGKLHKKKCR